MSLHPGHQISYLKWSFQIHQNKNRHSIFPFAATVMNNFPELDMLLNPSLVFAGTVCSAAFVPVISSEPYTPLCMCVFIVSIVLCIIYFVYFPALYCIIIYMAFCIVLYCMMNVLCIAFFTVFLSCIGVWSCKLRLLDFWKALHK